MKYLAPALVLFAILTDPAGNIAYIAKAQVVAIKAAVRGECDNDSHTKVFTASGNFCVAESVDDVRRKVEEQ